VQEQRMHRPDAVAEASNRLAPKITIAPTFLA
jgi:hypothetical protein